MTLTASQIADVWKPHDGGECPVDRWQPVTIMRRDGKIATHRDCRFLDWRPWEAYSHTDIIAYKEQSHASA